MNRLCIALYGLLSLPVSGCGPVSGTSEAATPVRTSEMAPVARVGSSLGSLQCPHLAVYIADNAEMVAGASAGIEASSGAYAYAEALPAFYSLRLLLDRTGDGLGWLDGEEPDLADIDMNVLITATSDYRLEGTCGRIYIENYLGYDTKPVEVFYTLDAETRSLMLYDSLGTPAGVLPALGRRAAAPRRTLPAPAAGRVTFDPAGPDLMSAAGRASLNDVLPYGTWYARPSGVRYQDSDLVLVHTCDPYPIGTAGRCGEGPDFDMDNPPPSILRTHVGVRLVGDRFELTPYAADDRPEFRETRSLILTPSSTR